MRIFWKIRHGVSRILYAVAERLPAAWTRKISLLLCVLRQDWRTVRFLSGFSAELGSVSAAELERHFAGLDRESLARLKRYLGKSHFTPWFDWITAQTPLHYHAWAGLCTEEEYLWGRRQEEAELPALRKKYHLPPPAGEVGALVFHHGLKDISPGLKSYVRGKTFIDAGAFIGDSALVLLEYEPDRIYAFEPSRANQRLFRKLMEDNQVPAGRVVIVDQGLSARPGTATFSENTAGTALDGAGACRVELVTLDEFVKTHGIAAVGFIKADVEGMGLELLKGAVATLRRDKPILSLSIYHNREEFLGTYDLLRSLNLPYRYEVASHCLPWQNSELVLLAFPVLPPGA